MNPALPLLLGMVVGGAGDTEPHVDPRGWVVLMEWASGWKLVRPITHEGRSLLTAGPQWALIGKSLGRNDPIVQWTTWHEGLASLYLVPPNWPEWSPITGPIRIDIPLFDSYRWAGTLSPREGLGAPRFTGFDGTRVSISSIGAWQDSELHSIIRWILWILLEVDVWPPTLARFLHIPRFVDPERMDAFRELGLHDALRRAVDQWERTSIEMMRDKGRGYIIQGTLAHRQLEDRIQMIARKILRKLNHGLNLQTARDTRKGEAVYLHDAWVDVSAYLEPPALGAPISRGPPSPSEAHWVIETGDVEEAPLRPADRHHEEQQPYQANLLDYLVGLGLIAPKGTFDDWMNNHVTEPSAIYTDLSETSHLLQQPYPMLRPPAWFQEAHR